MDILDQTKTKMVAALDHLTHELKSIRTGRANPGMLDHVTVDMYGSSMRIKELASVTCPEPRQLLITPFDRTTTPVIGKAIEKANLGFMPIVDGNAVRIKIPAMDDNMRKEMIKLCYKRLEEVKVIIRNVRRDANDLVRRQKKEGTLPEDLVNKLEKNIQELTDKSCKDADDIAAKKEKEIATV